MKLIIDIPENEYKRMTEESIYSTHTMICAIQNSTPLDSVKAEIVALPKTYPFVNHIDIYVKEEDVLHILDNIGKEEKHTCSNCQHRNPVDDNEYRCFMRASLVTRLGSDTCKLWE